MRAGMEGEVREGLATPVGAPAEPLRCAPRHLFCSRTVAANDSGVSSDSAHGCVRERRHKACGYSFADVLGYNGIVPSGKARSDEPHLVSSYCSREQARGYNCLTFGKNFRRLGLSKM